MECWALATGASRGLGLALARGLARRGCSLVLSSRSMERLRRAAAELQAPRVKLVRADLRIEEDVDLLVDRLLEASEGRVRAAVLSYGNPLCEPSTLDEVPYSCWAEAARLYLASTSKIISRLAREAGPGMITVAAVSSFTTRQPHQPLVVADAVRRGLEAVLYLSSRRWPGRIQSVLLLLGSFLTPGARETVSLVSGGEPFEEAWRVRVESLSPLGRAGRLEELEDVAGLLLDLPEYVTYTPLLVDGGSLGCVC